MESKISLGFGHKLVTPNSPAISYIKIVNSKDKVVQSWDYWQWQTSPMLVMGEIISQISATFSRPLPHKVRNIASANFNLIHIKEFAFSDVFPYLSKRKITKIYSIIRPFQSSLDYSVKMNSQRYHVFAKNLTCVICGLEGTKLILDQDMMSKTNKMGQNIAHFNLYGEENGALVVFTKDHITPASKDGRDHLDNYQTMCCICNNLKGDCSISNEDLLSLRRKFRPVN